MTLQRGGGSKDTWVVSEGPVTAVSLLAPTRLSVQRERLDAELPSRVADNLFWLGRHIERAEHTARLLRSLVTYVTREDVSEDTPELVALLHVLADMKLIPRAVAGTHAAAGSRAPAVARCSGSTRSLPSCARRWARCGGSPTTVRDRLSLDTWRILNQLQPDLRLRQGRIQFDDVLVHLNRM